MRGLLASVKISAAAIQPYLPLTPAAVGDWSQEKVSAAIDTLTKNIDSLGASIEGSARPYSISDFDSLLAVLSEGETEAESPMIAQARRLIPLFSAAKAVFIDGNPQEIQPGNWKTFLWEGSRLFGWALRFGNTVGRAAGKSWLSYDVRKELVEHGLELLAAAERATMRMPGEQIPMGALDILIDQVSPLLTQGGFDIQAITLKQTIRPVFNRIFGDPRDPKDMITPRSIQRIRTPFVQWSEGMNYLNLAFAKLAKDPKEKFPMISSLDLLRLSALETLGPDYEWKQGSAIGMRMMRTLVKRGLPLFYDDSGEIQYKHVPGAPKKPIIEVDLTHKFWTYTICDLFFRSYAAKQQVATPEEFLEYARDFARSLDLKHAVRPFNKPYILEQFQQTNLFTDAGNGDRFLDKFEISQDLLLMMSSKKSSKENARGRSADCAIVPTKPDIWGLPTLDRACMRHSHFAQQNGHGKL